MIDAKNKTTRPPLRLVAEGAGVAESETLHYDQRLPLGLCWVIWISASTILWSLIFSIV